jgi:hypothetical protein
LTLQDVTCVSGNIGSEGPTTPRGISGERRPQEWLDWGCPVFDTLGAVSILTWTLLSTEVEPAILLLGISVVFGWILDQDTDYRDRDFYGCPQALHTDIMSILKVCILTPLQHRRQTLYALFAIPAAQAIVM